MSKMFVTGLVNGNEVEIAVVSFQDSPPHEVSITPSKHRVPGITDISVVGLQYYEFSMFTIMLEVLDSNGEPHHFMLDSWAVRDVYKEAMQPLKIDNPYIYFNKYVSEQLVTN